MFLQELILIISGIYVIILTINFTYRKKIIQNKLIYKENILFNLIFYSKVKSPKNKNQVIISKFIRIIIKFFIDFFPNGDTLTFFVKARVEPPTPF